MYTYIYTHTFFEKYVCVHIYKYDKNMYVPVYICKICVHIYIFCTYIYIFYTKSKTKFPSGPSVLSSVDGRDQVLPRNILSSLRREWGERSLGCVKSSHQRSGPVCNLSGSLTMFYNYGSGVGSG